MASSALADGQTYENSDFGVTLKYPKDWTIQENVMGVLAAFMSPLADKQDTFAENVTFVAQSLGGEKVSLKDLGKASAAQLEKVITDFKLESNEGAKAGQYDALKLVYTGKQGAVDLKWAQFYTVIEKGNMYILTFTAPTDQFDAVNSTAENIVNSIQIK